MKIIQKILPVLVLGGVISSSIPMMSCSSGEVETFKYTFDDKNKAADFHPLDFMSKPKDMEHITQLFINDMNQNKKIFADQIVYSVINHFMYFDWLDDMETDFPTSFIDAKGTVEVEVGHLDAETGKCSFGYEFNFKVNDIPYFAHFYFKNVRFILFQPGQEGYIFDDESPWCFAPVQTALGWGTPNDRTPRQGTFLDCQIYASYLRYEKDWEVGMDVSRNLLALNNESTEEYLTDTIPFVANESLMLSSTLRVYISNYGGSISDAVADFLFIGQYIAGIQYLTNIE